MMKGVRVVATVLLLLPLLAFIACSPAQVISTQAMSTRSTSVVVINGNLEMDTPDHIYYNDTTIYILGDSLNLSKGAHLSLTNCTLQFNNTPLTCGTIRVNQSSRFDLLGCTVLSLCDKLMFDVLGDLFQRPYIGIKDTVLVNVAEYGIIGNKAEYLLDNVTFENYTANLAPLDLVNSKLVLYNNTFDSMDTAVVLQGSLARIKWCDFKNQYYAVRAVQWNDVLIAECTFDDMDYLISCFGTSGSSSPQVIIRDCTYDYFSTSMFDVVGYNWIEVYHKTDVYVENGYEALPNVPVEMDDGSWPTDKTDSDINGYAHFPSQMMMQIIDESIAYVNSTFTVTYNGLALSKYNVWPMSGAGMVYFTNRYPNFKYVSFDPTLNPDDAYQNSMLLSTYVSDYEQSLSDLNISIHSNSAKGIIDMEIPSGTTFIKVTWDAWFEQLNKQWAGTVSFRLRVEDGWGLVSYSDSYEFTVLSSVNSEPIIDDIPSLDLLEDTPKDNILDLKKYIHDPDDDFQDLTITIPTVSAGGEPDVELSIDEDGFLDVVYFKKNFTGYFLYEILVEDDDGHSTYSYPLLYVQNVNDPPAISYPYAGKPTYQVEEDSYELFSSEDLFIDSDSTLEYKTEYNPNVTVELGETVWWYGQDLYIEPAENFSGTQDVTIYALDGYTSTELSITVEVLPVNDAPVIKCREIYQVTVGDRLEFNVQGEDPDGQADMLKYRSSITDAYGNPFYGDERILYLDPVTGDFTYVPQEHEEGTIDFVLQVTDTSENTTTKNVSIEILVSNHLPHAWIDSPNKYDTYYDDEPVLFSSENTYDLDLDDPNDLQFRWVSDIQGELGYGRMIYLDLIKGMHHISLYVFDGEDTVTAWVDQVQVVASINITPPPPPIEDDSTSNRTWEIPEYKEDVEDANTMGYVILLILAVLVIVILGYVVISQSRTPLSQLAYLLKDDRYALREEYRERERKRQEKIFDEDNDDEDES